MTAPRHGEVAKQEKLVEDMKTSIWCSRALSDRLSPRRRCHQSRSISGRGRWREIPRVRGSYEMTSPWSRTPRFQRPRCDSQEAHQRCMLRLGPGPEGEDSSTRTKKKGGEREFRGVRVVGVHHELSAQRNGRRRWCQVWIASVVRLKDGEAAIVSHPKGATLTATADELHEFIQNQTSKVAEGAGKEGTAPDKNPQTRDGEGGLR